MLELSVNDLHTLLLLAFQFQKVYFHCLRYGLENHINIFFKKKKVAVNEVIMKVF